MIQYFPIVTGSLTVLGNINVSGSITTSGSITISGSITSASFASTASFVALAQSASNAVSAATASFANTLTVAGNLTAQTLVVQTITSSVDFVTGSTRFGSLLGNTHVFSGSVTMNPGGLFVSSSGLVGIGTTSPAYILDVNGTGKFTRMIVGGTATSRILQVNTSGNDGIRIQTSGDNPTLDLMQTAAANAGARNWRLVTNWEGWGTLDFQSGTNNTQDPATTRLSISGTTGAATFSNSVNLGSIANSGDTSLLNIKQSSTSYNNGIYLERGGERNGYFMYIGGAVDSLTFRRNYFGTQSDVMSLTRNGTVGIGTSNPSQKLHVVGGFLQTYDNSSWYRNVFERNVTSWDNVVGFSPQSSPQYTYGYINITASAYNNGTSAGGVVTSRWYYSITNNSISVSVVGSDISTGSQAPMVRLVVSSGTIYVQVQSTNGSTAAYTTVFVDAMLASGYVNGTYWIIS